MCRYVHSVMGIVARGSDGGSDGGREGDQDEKERK